MNPRSIRHIVIHCSASMNGDARITRDVIDGWHREKGWNGVGYHYVIHVDGSTLVGRPEAVIGAHVAGENATSIGVCMIGTDRFTVEQWHALRALVRELALRYPGADVLGHRNFSPDKNGDGVIEPWEWFKTCPGFSARDWLAGNMQPPAKHVLPQRITT